ncbi:DNA double-strand break repair nuclease NurA [uncultured Methanobrevibacter sp.]|uniref:DNA double-strand break repair nuclease NurA n=1 Tax=uncultured Methanobrevibacter sp. TaxID=253161 RepID=UPI002624A8A0
MLDSLYTEAIKKKGLISEPIKEIEESKIDLESNWFDEEIPLLDNKPIISAGDGSYNKKKYLAFNFYAVAAESLIFNPNETGGEKLKTIESVELNITEHHNYLEERLRNMMSVLEKKTAIKTFKEYDIDYYLDDGSLMGDLIRPIPADKSLSPEFKQYLINQVKDVIEDDIENSDEIRLIDFKNEFKNIFQQNISFSSKSEAKSEDNELSEDNSGNDLKSDVNNNSIDSSGNQKIEESIDKNQSTLESFLLAETQSEEENKDEKNLENEQLDEADLISFLETIENLIALKHLLKYKRKIVAISKTSSSNGLFHANIPDMAILDRFTSKEGFSKPYYRKVSSKVKRDFPIGNEFFRELTFTIFFARLKDNKNIIKIELPYYAKEEDIKRVLSDIKRDSTDGYPFLLKKAHHDVVITNQDMVSLSNIIGFLDKSGREMLN